eukprot:SAG11_NODE_499_length_8940_cov_5.975455_2_plen_232_part_00
MQGAARLQPEVAERRVELVPVDAAAAIHVVHREGLPRRGLLLLRRRLPRKRLPSRLHNGNGRRRRVIRLRMHDGGSPVAIGRRAVVVRWHRGSRWGGGGHRVVPVWPRWRKARPRHRRLGHRRLGHRRLGHRGRPSSICGRRRCVRWRRGRPLPACRLCVVVDVVALPVRRDLLFPARRQLGVLRRSSPVCRRSRHSIFFVRRLLCFALVDQSVTARNHWGERSDLRVAVR